MAHNEMAMFANFGPNKSFVPVESVQNFTAGQIYRIDLANKNVQGVSRAVLAWARPAELGHPTKIDQAFTSAKNRRFTLIL